MKKFKQLREQAKRKLKKNIESDDTKPIPDVEGQTYFDFEGAKREAEEKEAAKRARERQEKLDDEAFDKETLYGRRGR